MMLTCRIFSSAGPVICTSLSLAPGTTLCIAFSTSFRYHRQHHCILNIFNIIMINIHKHTHVIIKVNSNNINTTTNATYLWKEMIVSVSSSIMWTRRPFNPITLNAEYDYHYDYDLLIIMIMIQWLSWLWLWLWFNDYDYDCIIIVVTFDKCMTGINYI